jgi:hypothetical protein
LADERCFERPNCAPTGDIIFAFESTLSAPKPVYLFSLQQGPLPCAMNSLISGGVRWE